jgi:hypothetical protein
MRGPWLPAMPRTDRIDMKEARRKNSACREALGKNLRERRKDFALEEKNDDLNWPKRPGEAYCPEGKDRKAHSGRLDDGFGTRLDEAWGQQRERTRKFGQKNFYD